MDSLLGRHFVRVKYYLASRGDIGKCSRNARERRRVQSINDELSGNIGRVGHAIPGLWMSLSIPSLGTAYRLPS
jgi:hypothetical protein